VRLNQAGSRFPFMFIAFQSGPELIYLQFHWNRDGRCRIGRLLDKTESKFLHGRILPRRAPPWVTPIRAPKAFPYLSLHLDPVCLARGYVGEQQVVILEEDLGPFHSHSRRLEQVKNYALLLLSSWSKLQAVPPPLAHVCYTRSVTRSYRSGSSNLKVIAHLRSLLCL
jgi:hypothetical protein